MDTTKTSETIENKESRFHLFTSLPPELREKIWLTAIASPGIHFLRLFDPSRHPHNEIISGPSWDYNFSLGAPWNPSLGRCDWIQGNDSAYWVEYILSNTCRESREVVLRMRNRGSRQSIDPESIADEGTDLSTVSTYLNEDAQNEAKFYINNRQDVVCLQFCDYEHARVENPWAEAYAPFWGNGFNLPEIVRLEHVAIEYKPQWDEAFLEMDPDGLLMGVPLEPEYVVPELVGPKWVPFHFPALRGFYVVDYSIKHRGGEAWDHWRRGITEQQLFCSGGRTFYVVEPGDEAWVVSSRAHAFVDWLRDEYPAVQLTHLDDIDVWGEPPLPPKAKELRFKVLGCV
jgi:hypothetical protein